MSNYRLLEDGTSKRLLENGTDFRVIEGEEHGEVSLVRQGTVGSVLSVALIGLACALGQGTVTPNGGTNQITLTGQATTSATGTLVQSAARPLTGQLLVGTQGALVATGRSLLQSAQGATVPSNTQALTGQASTTGTGLISPNSNGTVPLVGSVSTSATGILLAPGGQPLTGLASTASPGTLAPTLRPTDIVGQTVVSATGFLAIAANNVTVNITGEDILSAQGFVDSTPNLVGQVITTAPGTLIQSRSLALVGLESVTGLFGFGIGQDPEDTYIRSTPGTVGLSMSTPLVGSASASASGTLGITSDANVALTGSQSVPASGTLAPMLSLAVAGEGLQSAQGLFGAPGGASLIGQAITSQTGTIFTTADRTQALTGSASVLAQGFVASGPRVALLVGLQLTTGSGQLVAANSDMSLALTGQSSTGNTGILGVIGQDLDVPHDTNEGCSVVSGIAEETEVSPVGIGAEGCFIQSGTAKEVA